MPDDSLSGAPQGFLGHLVRQVLVPNVAVRPRQAHPSEMQRSQDSGAAVPFVALDGEASRGAECAPHDERIESVLELVTREGMRSEVPNAPSDDRIPTTWSAAPEARAVHNVDESPHVAASTLRDVDRETRTPDAIDERGYRAADAEPSSHGTTAQPSDTAGEAAASREAVQLRLPQRSKAELRVEQSESVRPRHEDRRVKRTTTTTAAVALPETAAKDERRGNPQQKALHRREAAEPLIQPSDVDLSGVRTDATLGKQSTGRVIEPAAPRQRDRYIAAQVTPLPSSLPAELQSHKRETNESGAQNVHVSIGRVEIRAVVVPSAPVVAKRVNAKAPAMSLSDYLKGRNGVQR